MLKSMTGFGRGEGETTLGRMVVECRCINHRYSDINLKLPKRFNPLEARIKEMVRSEVSRGRVDLTLRLETIQEGKVQFDVDLALADQYYRVLQQLKERFGMQGEITLDLLAGAKDLILAKEAVEDVEPYWQEMVPILKQSLKEMDGMKRVEGESLGRDLGQRMDRISQTFEDIRVPLRLFSKGLSGTVQGEASNTPCGDRTGSLPLPAGGGLLGRTDRHHRGDGPGRKPSQTVPDLFRESGPCGPEDGFSSSGDSSRGQYHQFQSE